MLFSELAPRVFPKTAPKVYSPLKMDDTTVLTFLLDPCCKPRVAVTMLHRKFQS